MFLVIIAVLLTSVITYFVVRSVIAKADDKKLIEQNQALTYEADSLKMRVGMLEGLLHSKEKDMSAVQETVLKLQTQLHEEVDRNAKVVSQSKSSQVRVGQVAENLAPFLMEGLDPKRMRFLGSPIDLICFSDDEVVFIEVKTNKSKLSDTQKNIKRLIEEKRVSWREFRISGDPQKK